MKLINIEVLQRGDIVLTTSPAKDSWVIRAGTLSDISHAMLCVSRGSVIDSTGEGVQARNVQKLLYPESCAIYILRLKEGLPESKVTEVIDYVRAETGAPYTVPEAIASIAGTGKGSDNQFCSRLVARAFASVGVNLVKNPNFCTPAALKRSRLLRRVENACVTVEEEEIQALEAHGDNTIGMREATNILLNKARKICDGIRVINDIPRTAIEQPKHDGALAAALSDSGYLEFWKAEVDKHPWRYDPVAITQFYHALPNPSVLVDYCRETLLDDENGVFRHWELTLKSLSELNKEFPRETLSLLVDLYMRLSFFHHLRVKSAKVIISVYGQE